MLAHAVAIVLVGAICAHLNVFAPPGRTWERLGTAARDALLMAVFASPLVCLPHLGHVRRPKTLLITCVLGATWAVTLTWLCRQLRIDLAPGQSLGR